MKLIHISDLHLGKRVHEYSMTEDISHALSQILAIVKEELPCSVLIAGDVYDKPTPSGEAVTMLDDFLVQLADMGGEVVLISGNHDSAERLSFGGRLMASAGVHFSSCYGGHIAPVVLSDEYGKVNIYMLPYLKPGAVRPFFSETILSYTDALALAVGEMKIDPSERNVLLAHQFVVGGLPSDSEQITVGGSDAVDGSVFFDFDYVALGHLHRPQSITPTIRYSGTPLPYSFSECGDEKSVTVVTLGEKGDVSLRLRPLTPLHPMREWRGTYRELMARSFYEGQDVENTYAHITLTDEEDIPDAIGKLRTVYKNLMKLDYDNHRTRATAEVLPTLPDAQSPLELFRGFYEMQNGLPMTPQQESLVVELLEKITEEDE